MTDLRTAAQQALEACKLIVSAFDALKPASAARNEPLQINATRASITALEAALAEPVQCADNDSPWLICKPCAAEGVCKKAEPVQAKPWVGLTEDERTDICDGYGANIHWRAFRAIEAKLQEKNT